MPRWKLPSQARLSGVSNQGRGSVMTDCFIRSLVYGLVIRATVQTSHKLNALRVHVHMILCVTRILVWLRVVPPNHMRVLLLHKCTSINSLRQY